jgi:uncharacterized protein
LETRKNGRNAAAWERLSSLAPDLELIEVLGKSFCFCAPSCSFIEVDDSCAAVVKHLIAGTSYGDLPVEGDPRSGQNSLDEVLEELNGLMEAGMLSADPESGLPGPAGSPSVSMMALIMATDCNLRCRYCYAEDGSYHQERSLMSFAVAKQAVDMLHHGSRRTREAGISFFGGEPLLNFGCIRKVVEYAESTFGRSRTACSFGITTNGILLTEEKLRYMEDHQFSYIISIDGPREIHDRNRVFPNQKGSYSVLLKKLGVLTEKFPAFRNKVTIRSTFTGQDHDLTAVLSHLHDLGFSKVSLESCSAIPKHIGIHEENLSAVLEEYDRVAAYYLDVLKSDESFNFHHFSQLLQQVANGTRRITQCGAGRGYLAVSPSGTLYPCHRLVGNESYAMGSVFDGADKSVGYMFGTASVPYKSKCRACWARYICGGGCHATAIQFNQDILKPYDIECSLMKHRIRLGAWLFTQLRDHYSLGEGALPLQSNESAVHC